MTYPYARKTQKVWHTSVNGLVHVRTIGNDSDDSDDRNKKVLFEIKQGLVSSGTGAWTVLASSGKAGGASLIADTNDNWTLYTDLVRGPTDTDDRSWILLRSPRSKDGGYYYLLIDYFGGTDEKVNYYFTRSQPDISSPAIDARPPSTGDEWSHLDEYVCSTDKNGQTWTTMVMSRANDGSFVAGVKAPGDNMTENGQYCCALIMFNVLEGKKQWDDAGAVSLVRSGFGQAMFIKTTMPFQTLHQDGSQVTCHPIQYQVQNGNIQQNMGTDLSTGEWPGIPVWLVSIDTGKKTLRGWLEDLYWAPVILRDGVSMFSGEVIAATKMGPFSVPVSEVVGL